MYNTINFFSKNTLLTIMFLLGLTEVALAQMTKNTDLGKGSSTTSTSVPANKYTNHYKCNVVFGEGIAEDSKTNYKASYNVFIGYQTGYSTTSGNDNIFVGYESGHDNTTGGQNVFIGERAGRSNITGKENTFIGQMTGYYNTTGNYNTFLGKAAGHENKTGRHNVYIGQAAGYKSTGSYNVFLGHKAGYKETGAYKLYIAHDDTDTPLVYGEFDKKKLGINVKNSQLKGAHTLYVGGAILSEGLTCKTKSAWPDYVFGKDYQLRPLEAVKAFIDTHQHLPEIPSAQQVAQQGVDVVKVETLLLKKIEELTLYLIQQNEQIKQLQQNNALLANQIKSLK